MGSGKCARRNQAPTRLPTIVKGSGKGTGSPDALSFPVCDPESRNLLTRGPAGGAVEPVQTPELFSLDLVYPGLRGVGLGALQGPEAGEAGEERKAHALEKTGQMDRSPWTCSAEPYSAHSTQQGCFRPGT